MLPKTCYFGPLRQMLRLVAAFLRPVLYPSDGELLDEGMHVWANLTTSQHNERKEEVDSGERAPILVFFRSTASTRYFPTKRSVFSRSEPAQGLTMVIFK